MYSHRGGAYTCGKSLSMDIALLFYYQCEMLAFQYILNIDRVVLIRSRRTERDSFSLRLLFTIEYAYHL